jgi:CHASE2 domain-containing sensor protein
VEQIKASRQETAPLWRRLLKALPIIALVSLFTLALEHYGWLRSLETAALDRFFVLKAQVPASDVVLVQIDDQDYQQLFHETSPLDPLTLADIVDAIAKNQPRLIAVDIDTSANIFKDMKISSSSFPIVWARGAHQEECTVGCNNLSLVPPAQQKFVLEGVLGRKDPPAGLPTGIALMPLDSDSQIRHLQREFPIAASQNGSSQKGKVDSFHWAVVKKYCELMPQEKKCATLTPVDTGESDLILNLAIAPYAFDPPLRASRVLDESRTGNVNSQTPVFLSIKDRIVILGGTYEASSDYPQTLTGVKHGIDLTAIAVESELSGTGLRNASSLVLVTLEVLAGLMLVVLNYYFPVGWKHLIALTAIPFFALLGSFVAFSSLALWASFFPTLVATQVHILYEKLRKAKLLERQVEELQRRLNAYAQPAQNDVDDAVNDVDDELA